MLHKSRISAGANKRMKTRSWDDMHHEVLVEIMKRVTWRERIHVATYVSKSWLSAVLDSMSPPGVIDLRPLDLPEVEIGHQRFLCLISLMIDRKPPDSWSTLYLAENLLKPNKYIYIAKRTPKLQELIIPPVVGLSSAFLTRAMPHWKELKRVQLPGRLLGNPAVSLQSVTSMRLMGVVDDGAAALVRDCCPNLRYLRLISCALSVNALSMILDAHKKLELFDVRHSFRVPNCKAVCRLGPNDSIEWNEEEIRGKAAGVKVYLSCDRQSCRLCAASSKFCVPKSKRLMCPEACFL